MKNSSTISKVNEVLIAESVPLMCVHEEKARGELVTVKVEGVSRERELWLVHFPSHSSSMTG